MNNAFLKTPTLKTKSATFKFKRVKHGSVMCYMLKKGKLIYSEKSILSKKDNFEFVYGMKISLKKVLIKSNFTKSEKRLIWKQFLDTYGFGKNTRKQIQYILNVNDNSITIK